ncbi:hypothetical protein PaelaDRAFT_3858 [Paenibacillus lactis 154]|uniref:Uncharacterized protein n=1 Tax=Paenibacillus lactis 154 TaxID=743719 RepID=G4HIP7_9BACL|nr:hypothetical protein PaelaDRAFT_3858 [Paenibacillus lactis 154]
MRLPNEQLLPGYNKKLPQGSLPAKAPSIIIRELPSIFNRHRLQIQSFTYKSRETDALNRLKHPASIHTRPHRPGHEHHAPLTPFTQRQMSRHLLLHSFSLPSRQSLTRLLKAHPAPLPTGIKQKSADAGAKSGTCPAACRQTRRPGSAAPVPVT